MRPWAALAVGSAVLLFAAQPGPSPWRDALSLPPAERMKALEPVLRSKLGDTEAGQIHLSLASACRQAGKLEDALAHLEDPSVRSTPLWEYGAYWRAGILAGLGRGAEALPLWIELYGVKGQPSFRQEAASALAKDAESRSSWAEAVPYLESLSEEKPEDPEVLARLASAYLDSGRGPEGGKVARTLWCQHPSAAGTLKLFNRFPEAEQSLRSLGAEALLPRLRSLARTESWWRIERELPGLPATGQWAAWTEYFRGRLLEARKRYGKSLNHYRNALQGPPEAASEALAGACRILTEHALPASQVKSWEDRVTAFRGGGGGPVEAGILRLMKWHARKDEDGKAAKLARRVLESDPDQDEARQYLFSYAWKLWMTGSRKEAAGAFRALSDATRGGEDVRHAALFAQLRLGLLQGPDADRARTLLETDSSFGYFGYRVRGGPPGTLAPVDPFAGRPRPGPGSHRQKADELGSLRFSAEAVAEYEMALVAAKDPALQWDIAREEAARGDLRRSITFARRAFPGSFGEGGKTLPEAVWKALYPVAYEKEIRGAGDAAGIPWLLLTALVRQESLFDAEARSRSNALGLMQLLPSTGKATARKHGLQAPSEATFFDPAWNTRVGTAYFGDMLKRFDGRVELALAAYNAGPNRVEEWMKRPGCPATSVDFVESIPFRETRSYVRRILLNYWEYRRIHPEGATGEPDWLAKSLRPDPS